jgi:beta-aspartyl-peptidase (threonine type)
MKWVIVANASVYDKKGIAKAVSIGAKTLREGGSAVDAVEDTIRCMEDNPVFDAGTGCDINLYGLILMDASIMNGKNLGAGAVGAIRCVKNPISVARKVMELTDNTLIVGKGAEEFACKLSEKYNSITIGYDPRTETKVKKFRQITGTLYEEYDKDVFRDNLHAAADTVTRLQLEWGLEKIKKFSMRETGTVSACALDARGNYAAGASTGGWSLTIPGRIGDTPLIGCGVYAFNKAGCSSTSGIRGEENARLGGLTRKVCDYMMNGITAQNAVRLSTDYAFKTIGLTLKKGTLIAIDKKGQIGVNKEHNAEPISVCCIQEDRNEINYPLEDI